MERIEFLNVKRNIVVFFNCIDAMNKSQLS